MDEKVEILTIPVMNTTKEAFLNHIHNHFSEEHKKNVFIVTANPEIIMNTTTNISYKEILASADYIVPDGIGIIIASKILNKPLKDKLPGYELMHDFLAYANTNSKKVYFYGAKQGYAKKAAENAIIRYPDLQIAGFMDGYTSSWDSAAQEIASTTPDFVFVAMGAPKQEEWIATYKHLFPTAVLMGVGGSLDVLSGNVQRAPQFWVKNNVEWLYRLITQPSRAKRMMKIPLFLVMVVKERIRGNKNRSKKNSNTR